MIKTNCDVGWRAKKYRIENYDTALRKEGCLRLFRLEEHLKSGRILVANFNIENVTNCRVTICRRT